MATITFFSNMRAFANALNSKSGQIRDAIENVGDDPAAAACRPDRPPLVEKMMDQLCTVEAQCAALTAKTIDAKSAASATRIAEVATRLQSRCAGEMLAVEKFLKQYGYKRDFAQTQEQLADHDGDDADAAATSSDALETAAVETVPAEAVQAATTAVVGPATNDASTSAPEAETPVADMDSTVVYSSPTQLLRALATDDGGSDDENEGDISTVQKEPQNVATTGTPADPAAASDYGADVHPIDFSDAIATATPGPNSRAQADASGDGAVATETAATVAGAASEDVVGMTIGFKDEPEPVGTPSFDDCGFSALTMAMMHKNGGAAAAASPAGAAGGGFKKLFPGTDRKASLGARSEGSPAMPEMKSVRFNRNAAATRRDVGDHTPDLHLSQKIETYAQFRRESDEAAADADEELQDGDARKMKQGADAAGDDDHDDDNSGDDDRTQEIANPAATLNFSVHLEDLQAPGGYTPVPSHAANHTGAVEEEDDEGDEQEELKEETARTKTPSHGAPATATADGGTPQFSAAVAGTPVAPALSSSSSSSSSAVAPAVDLSHMLQFAPGAAGEGGAPNEGEGASPAAEEYIQAVTDDDLASVPAYLRSQFECAELNLALGKINGFLTETVLTGDDDAEDLVVTETQLREHVGLKSSKCKALTLLLVKMKRLRMVAKDQFMLPK